MMRQNICNADQTQMRVAFFDFDGTISFKDSFMGFLRYKNFSFFVKFLLILPFFVLYKLGLFSEHRLKNLALSLVFKGMSKADFSVLCLAYAREVLPSILRPLALKRLKWHKERGDVVVIVSASLEEYLAPWCEKNGFGLIASRLEVCDGRITGRLVGLNCHGDEKVCRIRQKYNLSGFETIYAYGDTKGDLPMLGLANESFYKPFRED